MFWAWPLSEYRPMYSVNFFVLLSLYLVLENGISLDKAKSLFHHNVINTKNTATETTSTTFSLCQTTFSRATKQHPEKNNQSLPIPPFQAANMASYGGAALPPAVPDYSSLVAPVETLHPPPHHTHTHTPWFLHCSSTVTEREREKER